MHDSTARARLLQCFRFCLRLGVPTWGYQLKNPKIWGYQGTPNPLKWPKFGGTSQKIPKFGGTNLGVPEKNPRIWGYQGTPYPPNWGGNVNTEEIWGNVHEKWFKKRSDSFKTPKKRGFTAWYPFWDRFEAYKTPKLPKNARNLPSKIQTQCILEYLEGQNVSKFFRNGF